MDGAQGPPPGPPLTQKSATCRQEVVAKGLAVEGGHDEPTACRSTEEDRVCLIGEQGGCA
jgi:hypothetical protein